MVWSDFAGSIAACLAGLIVAAAGAAEPPFPGGHRGRGPDGFIEEHAKELGLDEDVRQEIEKIVDQSREPAREIYEEMRDLRRTMHEFLDQETPDEAAVMRQVEAIGAAETRLQQHRLSTLLKIRALLTPEQRAQLLRIREESRTRWEQPLTEACGPDSESLCPAQEDRWSYRDCLRDHYEELSADCQAAIDEARGSRQGPHTGPGRRGTGRF